MGTSLSGGQKQRVLLARALYRRPRLLFMDEGTSHLDIATERQVTAAVKALGLTRMIIAHRPEAIASAPRRPGAVRRRIARIAGELADREAPRRRSKKTFRRLFITRLLGWTSTSA